MGFLVLLVLVVAGYFAWVKLVELEREIRSELEPKAQRATPTAPRDTAVSQVAPGAEDKAIQELILAKVRQSEGILQTELYEAFPELDRKTLRKCLLEMDHARVLRRERSSHTFKLYTA